MLSPNTRSHPTPDRPGWVISLSSYGWLNSVSQRCQHPGVLLSRRRASEGCLGEPPEGTGSAHTLLQDS